jgi:hypothetical protein
LKKLLAVLGLAMPVFAQYAGPAILSRGEAPSAMKSPQISFQPFLEVVGVYNTGLSGVTLDPEGNLAHSHSAGAEFIWGVSGSHSWRHTSIGLTYRGGYTYYPANGHYNSIDQSMLLGVNHQLTRHITFGWNTAVGVFNRDPGLLNTISPEVPFDPSQTAAPTTDFFNNRTITVSSSASLTIQRSTRLSFSFGGGLFTTQRQSIALFGLLGESATADVQYRLTKRATIGANYVYSHFSFAHLIANTNVQGAAATLGYQLSRNWEFSGFGGFARVESKFIQNVPVDPAVAAIIGISQSTEVVYSIRYVPNLGARISRTFHKGVWYASAGHTVTPGNGLFLTSGTTSVATGYGYTGLRKWSFGASLTYHKSESIGNVIGGYGGESANVSMSRQIARNLHMVAGISAQRYNSPDFAKYNQTVYSATLGLGWSPGDVPLRIW